MRPMSLSTAITFFCISKILIWSVFKRVTLYLAPNSSMMQLIIIIEQKKLLKMAFERHYWWIICIFRWLVGWVDWVVELSRLPPTVCSTFTPTFLQFYFILFKLIKHHFTPFYTVLHHFTPFYASLPFSNKIVKQTIKVDNLTNFVKLRRNK